MSLSQMESHVALNELKPVYFFVVFTIGETKFVLFRTSLIVFRKRLLMFNLLFVFS